MFLILKFLSELRGRAQSKVFPSISSLRCSAICLFGGFSYRILDLSMRRRAVRYVRCPIENVSFCCGEVGTA